MQRRFAAQPRIYKALFGLTNSINTTVPQAACNVCQYDYIMLYRTICWCGYYLNARQCYFAAANILIYMTRIEPE